MQKTPPAELKKRIKFIKTALEHGWLYREIAAKLGVTKGRVHQMVVKHEIVPDRHEEKIDRILGL